MQIGIWHFSRNGRRRAEKKAATRPRQSARVDRRVLGCPSAVNGPTARKGEDVPNVTTLEADSAPKEVVELYNDFQRRMGFPAAPNFIKTQGHSLAATRGTWGLVQNVLVGGLLPRTLKEMMFVAISQSRECRYCEAAHLACCRMLGIELSEIEKLVSNVADISPPKARDIILFGIKCARNPQSLTDGDFEGLAVTG
jgi:AhpD family alkylhydroperoxidase